MKRFLSVFSFFALLTASAFANVTVSSPQAGQTVTTSAHFIATANTSTCSWGVAAMGIYRDNVLKYVAHGTSLNTTVDLTPGNHNAVVQEWDFCGGATSTPVPITATQLTGVSVTSPAA